MAEIVDDRPGALRISTCVGLNSCQIVLEIARMIPELGCPMGAVQVRVQKSTVIETINQRRFSFESNLSFQLNLLNLFDSRSRMIFETTIVNIVLFCSSFIRRY